MTEYQAMYPILLTVLVSGLPVGATPDVPPEASPRFVSWPGQPSCLVVRGADAGGVWVLGDTPRQVVTGLVCDAAIGPGAQLLVLEGTGTVGRLPIHDGVGLPPASGSFERWAARTEPARAADAWQLAVMPDGTAWRVGATETLGADGRLRAVPGGLPRDAIPVAADPYGNLWAARDGPPDGGAAVAVLPCGSRSNWLDVAGCPVGPEARTVRLLADDVGGIWVSDGVALYRADPRQEGREWVSAGGTLPRAGITALAVAVGGAALVGFASGEVGVCDVDAAGQAVYRSEVEGRGAAVRALHVDADGNTWMIRGTALERAAPPAGAWQRTWRDAGRLPCGNHDLTAAVLDGVCYIAGGLALSCGYPAVKRIQEGVLAYDATRDLWVERARLAPGRAGIGLAAADGKLWIVNGHVAGEAGLTATRTVELFDPARGTLSRGPDTRQTRFFAIAATIGPRVYAIGGGPFGKPMHAVLESLAPGETAWREEGEAPCRLDTPVGCAYLGRLFVHVPGAGLISFDPGTKVWRANHAKAPRGFRSSQVAVFGDRLWFVGGRGTPTETDVFSYDGKTDTWRAEASAPRPCAWGAAAVVNGCLYIHGGAVGRCCSDRTFELRP